MLRLEMLYIAQAIDMATLGRWENYSQCELLFNVALSFA